MQLSPRAGRRDAVSGSITISVSYWNPGSINQRSIATTAASLHEHHSPSSVSSGSSDRDLLTSPTRMLVSSIDEASLTSISPTRKQVPRSAMRLILSDSTDSESDYSVFERASPSSSLSGTETARSPSSYIDITVTASPTREKERLDNGSTSGVHSTSLSGSESIGVSSELAGTTSVHLRPVLEGSDPATEVDTSIIAMSSSIGDSSTRMLSSTIGQSSALVIEDPSIKRAQLMVRRRVWVVG